MKFKSISTPPPFEPAWPSSIEPVELVPLSTIAPELSGNRTVADLARRFDGEIHLDNIGRRCVTADTAREMIAADRDAAKARERDARRRRLMAQRDRLNRRQPPTVAQLQAQLDALMADEEIAEGLQVFYAQDLMEKIRRIEQGDPEPEVVGSGVAFLGASDETVAIVKKRHDKEVKRASFGGARAVRLRRSER